MALVGCSPPSLEEPADVADASEDVAVADTVAGDGAWDAAAHDGGGGAADAPDAADASGTADASDAAVPGCPEIVPTAPPAALGLPTHYTRWIDVGGVPLVAAADVGDAALRRAAWILARMLAGRPCLQQALARSGMRFGVIGKDAATTSMPEYADLPKVWPDIDWDTRGRGYGATLMRPLCAGAEENLLQTLPDPWHGEVIFAHEAAHTIFEYASRDLQGGAAREAELGALRLKALNGGFWQNTYAASSDAEYWAEGVQSWLGDNLEADPPNGIHNHVNTRAELLAYDPGLAAFVAAILDPTPWPLRCSLEPTATPASWPILPDPEQASCTYERVWLQDLGCDAPLQGTAGEATVFELVHRGTTALVADEFGPDGAVLQSVTLAPRSQVTRATAAGRRWRLRSPEGACVAVVQIAAGAERSRYANEPPPD